MSLSFKPLKTHTTETFHRLQLLQCVKPLTLHVGTFMQHKCFKMEHQFLSGARVSDSEGHEKICKTSYVKTNVFCHFAENVPSQCLQGAFKP